MKFMISGHLLMLVTAFLAWTCEGESTAEDKMPKKRVLAQPWYLREIEIGGFSLYVSPVTVLVFGFSIYFLVSNWSSKEAYCEASHILLEDHSEESKSKLEDMKKKISNDPVIFSKYAKKFSSCPSKGNGGYLGRFKKGDMAPPFDKACFSRSNKVGEVVGPVQTQFGWHLIIIRERRLPDELS